MTSVEKIPKILAILMENPSYVLTPFYLCRETHTDQRTMKVILKVMLELKLIQVDKLQTKIKTIRGVRLRDGYKKYLQKVEL